MKLEEKIIHVLTKTHQTLSIAESCTGGLVSNKLTNISGSSKVVKLGVVAYSNEAKVKILNVPQSLLKKYGAVHESIAIAMAEGVCNLLKTDFSIGITGIAGPTGTTQTKPIGLTYIAIKTPTQIFNIKCLFNGTRRQIKTQASKETLKLLYKNINSPKITPL